MTPSARSSARMPVCSWPRCIEHLTRHESNCYSAAFSARQKSTKEFCQTSFPKLSISATILHGEERILHQGWWTEESRSLALLIGRWLSMLWIPMLGPIWRILKVGLSWLEHWRPFGSQTLTHCNLTDSNSPTWDNMINGQVNLYDAIRRQIDFKLAGKDYKLRDDCALPTLIVRYVSMRSRSFSAFLLFYSPRGWHLEEKHFVVDGTPISGGLFDFGLYFFHNAKLLITNGHGPYFYLPKMESHLEARLWNDVFNLAQDSLRIPRGTIRGTVLIETILAVFEMDEVSFFRRECDVGASIALDWPNLDYLRTPTA